MAKEFEIFKNGIAVFLSGELDQYAAAALKTKIDIEVEASGKKNLIIDLSDVSFMDSSGIGLIIGRYKILQSLGGRVVTCGGNPNVRKVITLSRIEKIVPWFDSIEDAIKNL